MGGKFRLKGYTKLFRELQIINGNLAELNNKFTCLEKEVLIRNVAKLETEIPIKGDRKAAYRAVFRLRSEGLKYAEIRNSILHDFGIKLSDSTLYDWLIGGKKPQ
jgi:hypothetical protein